MTMDRIDHDHDHTRLTSATDPDVVPVYMTVQERQYLVGLISQVRGGVDNIEELALARVVRNKIAAPGGSP